VPERQVLARGPGDQEAVGVIESARISVCGGHVLRNGQLQTGSNGVPLGSGGSLTIETYFGQEKPLTSTAPTPLPMRGRITLAGAIDALGFSGDGLQWVGSPILNIAGLVSLIPRTVDQLLINGGTISLSGAQVMTAAGSSLNLNGGYIHYLGGVVDTTRLVDANGAIVPIGQASPYDTFVGIAGDDWRPGVGMELGFVKSFFDERFSVGEDFGVGLVGESVGGDESGGRGQIRLFIVGADGAAGQQGAEQQERGGPHD